MRSKLKSENLLYKDHIIGKLWNFSFLAAVQLNMAHCEKKMEIKISNQDLIYYFVHFSMLGNILSNLRSKKLKLAI